jgi:hypothetical protein
VRLAISHYLGQAGGATRIARSGNAKPLADGTYAPGTIFNFKGGRPGYRVNHYAMVGPDGKYWLESDWARPNTVSNNRRINWSRDISAAGRINAGVPRGYAVASSPITPAASGQSVQMEALVTAVSSRGRTYTATSADMKAFNEAMSRSENGLSSFDASGLSYVSKSVRGVKSDTPYSEYRRALRAMVQGRAHPVT